MIRIQPDETVYLRMMVRGSGMDNNANNAESPDEDLVEQILTISKPTAASEGSYSQDTLTLTARGRTRVAAFRYPHGSCYSSTA